MHSVTQPSIRKSNVLLLLLLLFLLDDNIKMVKDGLTLCIVVLNVLLKHEN